MCTEKNYALSSAFIDIPPGDRLIRIYAPVAQKGPVCAVPICFIQVQFPDHYLFFIVRGFFNDTPKRIGNK